MSNRSNISKIIFSILVFIVSGMISLNTITFSGCIGFCNGLEGLLIIFLLVLIRLVFELICPIDSKNKNFVFISGTYLFLL